MWVLVKALLLVLAIQESLGVQKFEKIIDGTPTTISSHPYLAHLVIYYSGRIKCGGAIIKTNMILTAAHCLDAPDFLVYVNVGNNNDFSLENPYDIKDMILYPEYRGETSLDIGLVILKQHIKLSDTVRLIKIASNSPRIGSKVTVAGFGYDKCDEIVWITKYRQHFCKGHTSTILKSAVLRVIRNRNGILYTRGENQNTCYGDSGSPVVYNNKVVGIVSSGENADCTGYDTHTVVARYYRWIKSNMENLEMENVGITFKYTAYLFHYTCLFLC